MLLMMLLTLNVEDNEMIPRIMTGDLRKPQLDWLMLRKIPQVQETLKVLTPLTTKGDAHRAVAHDVLLGVPATTTCWVARNPSYGALPALLVG